MCLGIKATSLLCARTGSICFPALAFALLLLCWVMLLDPLHVMEKAPCEVLEAVRMLH